MMTTTFMGRIVIIQGLADMRKWEYPDFIVTKARWADNNQELNEGEYNLLNDDWDKVYGLVMYYQGF